MGKIYDSVIIGAGPAGISTAIYNSRGGISTAIIERGLYGGTLNDTDTVENYISYESVPGHKLAKNMESHVKAQENIEHIWGDVKSLTRDNGVYQIDIGHEKIKGKTVVIATGVKYKKMNIKGEEEFNGRGISNCVTCDINFFKDKNIFMIGGGDSAVEGAIYASNVAKHVTLIHRRDKLRADKILQDRLFEKENISVVWNANTLEFTGNNGMLDGLIYEDKITHRKAHLYGSGAFINIGIIPAYEPFKNLPIFSVSSNDGYIQTRSDMRTTTMNNLYAVGDIRANSIRQVVESVSDGAVASESIIKSINLKK